MHTKIKIKRWWWGLCAAGMLVAGGAYPMGFIKVEIPPGDFTIESYHPKRE